MLWSVTVFILGAPIESLVFVLFQIRIVMAVTWAIKKSSINTCKVL